MISPETIEQVKNISIVDVVSDIVKLKNSGSNFTGLCPFHSEKTPSFHVKTDNNFYHCFGCGASGDTITFVMKTQGLSYPDAIEYLANRFNIPIKYIKQKSDSNNRITATSIYKLNSLAYEFFIKNLRSANKEVKNYIETRGITEEDITSFGIGYAPNNWDDLYKFLLQRSSEESLIFASALVKKNTANKIYDTFRNRIIFPVWTDNKRIVGFGGRLIPSSDDNQPKYLNSPETLIYKKSQILFGFPQSYNTIKETGEVFVVEGYLDVVSLHRVGIKNVVATCGTALTSQHIKKLETVAKRIYLFFDGDEAGQAAASKSFRSMINLEAEIRVIFIPENQDPDDLAKKYKKETYNYISKLKKLTLMESFLKERLKYYQVLNFQELGPVNKSKIAKELLAIINTVTNNLIKSELLKEASYLTAMSQDELIMASKELSQQNQNKEKFINQHTIIEKEFLTGLNANLEDDCTYDLKISALNLDNKEFLRIAISDYEKYPKIIMNNPEICNYLDKSVLNFISGLDRIISDDLPLDQKRIKINDYVSSFDISILDFWKETMKRKSEKDFNLEKIFNDCMLKINKQNMQNQIKLLEQLKNETTNLEEKNHLIQEMFKIKQQLNIFEKDKILIKS